MTIIGIFGCTSLIVTGFGIKDSIKTIVPNQYEKVFSYNMQVSVKDDISEETEQKLVADLRENSQIQKADRNRHDVCNCSKWR